MNTLITFCFAHPVVGLIGLGISLFTAYVAVSALCRALAALAVTAANAVVESAGRATDALSDGLVSGVSGCAKAVAGGIGLVGWFLGRPFVHAWDWARDYATVLIDAVAGYIERERQLRELFRASSFRTWRAFRASFDGTSSEDDAAQPEDSSAFEFETACGLLGLPVTGLFTQSALNAAFRKLMQKAHPDRSGNTHQAAALNEARDFIRKYKGWT